MALNQQQAEIESLRAALAIERERNKILMTQITYAYQGLQVVVKMLGADFNANFPDTLSILNPPKS